MSHHDQRAVDKVTGRYRWAVTIRSVVFPGSLLQFHVQRAKEAAGKRTMACLVSGSNFSAPRAQTC